MTELMDLARLGSKTLTTEHVNGLAAMHAVRQDPFVLPAGPIMPALLFAETVVQQRRNPLATVTPSGIAGRLLSSVGAA